MNNFGKYYFKIEDAINEINILEESLINELDLLPNWRDLDPRRATNILRKMVGSGRTKIIPKSYETFEVEPWGYQDMFNKLTTMYNAPKKEKKNFFIKDLKQGVFNPKDSHEIFPELEKDDIDIVSVYKTNNGGTIILYQLKDEDGEDNFYIGLDGKAQKFFAAQAKKGGLGMLFKAWLSSQKTNKSIFTGASVKKGKGNEPIVVSREIYNKLVPHSTQNESININEKEEPRPLFFTNNKWFKWDENPTRRFAVSKPQKGDYEVDEKGYRSEEHKDELRKFKEPLGLDKIDDTGKGELYTKIKDKLESEPKQFSSKNVKNGWIYDLIGNDVIYVYEDKEGKYKIAWRGNIAKDILIKLGYLQRADVKGLK